MTETNTDRIEKEIVLKAPIARVFRALTDSEEFSAWFGVRLQPTKFEAGATLRGLIKFRGEDREFTAIVDRVEPPRVMAYRWHPFALDRKVDYSAEPMTLVTFELDEVAGGTKLRVVESGFDAIPVARRAEAFRMNTGGWEQQCRNLESYVGQAR